jgi:AcrR family transcriptional regulator
MAEIELGTLSESNRDRILRAATQLCAEQGYEATGIDEVVERAGLEREDFTNLFPSVEECLAAAISAVMTKSMTEIATAYRPDRSEWENGVAGMKAVLELMAAHPSSAHLVFIGARQMAPPAVYRAYETGVSVFAAMVERLWEYSEIDVQPASVSRAVIGSTEGVVRREIAAGRTDELPRCLPDVVYGYTVPFLGQEKALRLVGIARELLVGTPWE